MAQSGSEFAQVINQLQALLESKASHGLKECEDRAHYAVFLDDCLGDALGQYAILEDPIWKDIAICSVIDDPGREWVEHMGSDERLPADVWYERCEYYKQRDLLIQLWARRKRRWLIEFDRQHHAEGAPEVREAAEENVARSLTPLVSKYEGLLEPQQGVAVPVVPQPNAEPPSERITSNSDALAATANVEAQKQPREPHDGGSNAPVTNDPQQFKISVSKHSTRGPRSDDEGHRRIAELLAHRPAWETDLNSTCELLAQPPDGMPGPEISPLWRKKYEISSYAEVFEAIGDKEIVKHIQRRLEIGNRLLTENARKLSETLAGPRVQHACAIADQSNQ